MRMRKKRNLDSRLEKANSVLQDNPEELRGQWRDVFPGYKQLAVELGCGKGRFTADTAEAEPELFIAAVERVPEATVVGMERVTKRGLGNVRFIDMDVADICRVFAPNEVDRIYINFCDPWPSLGHARRRLTAPDFLTLYRTILKPGGELRFKTDNAPLFDWSVRMLKKCGWSVDFETHDLHKDGVCEIMTDYEAKFHSQGVPICKCIAHTPDKEEPAMMIEEYRPRGIMCLPESFSGEGIQDRIKRMLANTDTGSGLVSIGWVTGSREEGYTVDTASICSGILASALDDDGINSLLLGGAEPERLPGGRYAVFELDGSHFEKDWKEIMASVFDRGYTIDEPKPVIWELGTELLEDGIYRLCIPVRSEIEN